LQIKFRRNTSKTAAFGRRSLVLILAVFIVSFLIYFLSASIKPMPTADNKVYNLPIYFLDSNTYLIHTDTTDYPRFASTLLKYTDPFVNKPNSLQIVFYIPKHISVAALQNVYWVAQSTNFKTLLQKINN
jgi:hypothetical protein